MPHLVSSQKLVDLLTRWLVGFQKMLKFYGGKFYGGKIWW